MASFDFINKFHSFSFQLSIILCGTEYDEFFIAQKKIFTHSLFTFYYFFYSHNIFFFSFAFLKKISRFAILDGWNLWGNFQFYSHFMKNFHLFFFPLHWDSQTYNTTTIVVGNEAAHKNLFFILSVFLRKLYNNSTIQLNFYSCTTKWTKFFLYLVKFRESLTNHTRSRRMNTAVVKYKK